MHDFYPIWSVGFAVVLGLGAVVAVIVTARGQPDFFGGRFWKWVLVTAALSLANPFLATWGSPTDVSLEDAFLLRRPYSGLAMVLGSYAMFLGVVIGGLIAKLIRWKS